MLRKVFNRVRINFRNTKSERSANQSYRNYHMRIKHLFNKANIFNKFKKDINKYDKS